MKKAIVILTMLLVLLTGCNHTPAELDSYDSTAVATIYEVPEETLNDTLSTTMTTEPDESSKSSFSESKETAGAAEPATEIPEESKVTETRPQQTEEKETTQATEPVQTEAPKTTATVTTDPPVTEPVQTDPIQTTEPVETEPAETTEPPRLAQADSTEVAALVAMYVNQYRNSPATILPGLGNVAIYRANQLITSFSHADSASACTALQYGEFVDMTLYGCPESSNYYQGYNREAIAKGNWTGTADEIAQRIATGFKNSAKHWAYVGSDEYGYMAVGVVYDASNSTWYCCICMSTQNYGG